MLLEDKDRNFGLLSQLDAYILCFERMVEMLNGKKEMESIGPAHGAPSSDFPTREAAYCRMDAARYPTPHSVEKRKAPFTPPEPRAIFLLHNRRPNAPDGRAIEEPCPSRVFVSKYLRRKIDKLNFLQPHRRRKRSVRGTWC
jgi:hypothetical protein